MRHGFIFTELHLEFTGEIGIGERTFRGIVYIDNKDPTHKELTIRGLGDYKSRSGRGSSMRGRGILEFYCALDVSFIERMRDAAAAEDNLMEDEWAETTGALDDDWIEYFDELYEQNHCHRQEAGCGTWTCTNGLLVHTCTVCDKFRNRSQASESSVIERAFRPFYPSHMRYFCYDHSRRKTLYVDMGEVFIPPEGRRRKMMQGSGPASQRNCLSCDTARLQGRRQTERKDRTRRHERALQKRR